jgi:hypothetical protein
MDPMGPSKDMRFWKGKILIWVHQKTWGFWVHQKTWGGEKLAKFGRVHQKTWVPNIATLWFLFLWKILARRPTFIYKIFKIFIYKICKIFIYKICKMHFISLKMWLIIVKFGRSGDDIIILHCKLSIVAIFKNLTWQICQNSGEILFIYKVLSIQKDGGLYWFLY